MSDKKPITAKKTTEPQGAAVIQAIPLLIGPADDTVLITVQQRTSVAPANAFRLIIPIDLSSVFHRVAPFPGVKGVANQTEAWDHVGPTRNPQFDDGSQADEQLTEYTEGASFAYQLTGFPTAMAPSFGGPTNSSRFRVVAGFSPVHSLPSGADTWWPPSRGACK
jgi:hypothetical protein